MIPVLYILGTGRSGSTLLERMLAGYARTIAVGELRYVWREGFGENLLCSCGQPFQSCPFWQRVISRSQELDPAFGDVHELTRTMERLRLLQSAARLRWLPQLHIPVVRRQPFRDAWSTSQSNLATFYTAIHEASDGAVIIDSTKDTSYAHLLDTIPELNVGYVHLVRDSRAVAFSWTRRRIRPEVTSTVATMAQVIPWRSAIDWDTKYAMSSLLSLLRPGRVMTVQYESFVRQPDQTLLCIERFARSLGMPPFGDRAQDAAPDRYHSVSGNPLRFDKRALRLRVDDEWKTRMDRRDRALVTVLTAPFLLRHRMIPPPVHASRSVRESSGAAGGAARRNAGT